MVELYLCEDDAIQAENYGRQIQKAAEEFGGKMQFCYAAENPHELLEYLDIHMEEERRAVFFLDILLQAEEMDGLELARILRRRYPASELVFLTSEVNLAFKTYEYQLETLDYIVKRPEDMMESGNEKVRERIAGILRRVMEKEKRGTGTEKEIRFRAGNRYIAVRTGEIQCINAVKGAHYLEIFLENRRLTAGIALSEIKEMLGEGFWYCNKSCIVNMRMIREVDLKERFLWMKNGVRCEIANRELKKFREFMKESR